MISLRGQRASAVFAAAAAAAGGKRGPLLQQARFLNVHEHHGMKLLEQCGVATPKHVVASTAAEAKAAYEWLAGQHGVKDVVVKAQVLTGGRARGKFKSGFKGGVHVVASAPEAEQFAGKMIGQRLVTKQTGPEGLPCEKVMVAERIYLRREAYFSILMDRDSGGPVMLGSPRGGTSVEEIAEQLFTEKIDITTGPQPEQLARLAANMGFEPPVLEQVEGVMLSLWKFFVSSDATLVEVNPLAETPDGKVYAVDSKLSFDDNAEFRQPALFALRDRAQEDPKEIEAAQFGLNYVKLAGGDVAALANGAGLCMATIDLIKLHGGNPASFLDIGGGASKEMVARAFSILNADKDVRTILVNIFGGMANTAVVVSGILDAAKRVGLNKPLVLRLQGTAIDEAKKVVEGSGFRMLLVDDLDEAASKAVRIAAVVKSAEKIQLGVSFELPL